MDALFSPIVRQILFDRLAFRGLILGLSFVAALLGLVAAYYQKLFIDSLVGVQLLGAPQDQLSLLVFAFLSFLFSSVLNQSNLYLGFREALISQKNLARDLYRQALRLKSESLEKRTVGEIVSLYATDIPSATILLEQTLPFGASTFFPILLTPFALEALVGTPLWEAFICVVFIAGLNTALAFRQSRFFFHFKQLAAQRASLVNEWLQNIRTLKILNWIPAYEKRIFEVRERETLNRIRMVTNGQVMNAITSHAPFVFNIVAGVLLVVVQERPLSAGEIWAVFWILGLFLNRPLRQLPWFFTFAFDALTSTRRLEGFLKIQSFDNFDIKSPRNSTAGETLLEVKGLRWSNELGPVLQGLDLRIRKGEKVAILGEVGSGKSAFLLCLMGELKAHFENFTFEGQPVEGPVAQRLRTIMNYVPQESFLMNSTLRDNVSFEYEKSSLEDPELSLHLNRVDFNPKYEGLAEGLDTPIGERGVNLSGGQRQRLSLARSIAQRRSLILIDDSLSQLDSKTELKILQELFSGPLQNKTVIIATHRKTVLQFVDSVYEMVEGRLNPMELRP
ncbi:MAG: ATP-binding cassette domain-containing protein [Bdellovibrionales bacterium]